MNRKKVRKKPDFRCENSFAPAVARTYTHLKLNCNSGAERLTEQLYVA